MSKLITIFGATGNQGGSVIRTILEDKVLSKEFRIRAVTRDANKESSKALAAQDIEVVQGDMASPEDMKRVVSGSDTVFLVTNFWEYQAAGPEIAQGKTVADACKAEGIKHLIFSSLIDASKESKGRFVNITHFDGKAEIERYIREIGLTASFVMPGIFMTELFNLIQAQGDGSCILATPTKTDAPAPFVDIVADMGNFVRAALLNKPESGTNTIYASSDYYKFEDIPEHFEAATGKKLTVVTVPGEVFKSFLFGLSPGMREEVYENLMLLEGPGYYAGAELTSSLSLLSQKPVGLTDFFARNKDRW
ncbi:hypothetical protein N7466_003282 [Penicillium verhagenii]|uniref:uncharacterized protein n=1 Tax=Penicillium verhagenii TaxID=1562060 RepID=UPI002544EFF3|nr:uncharacterized protein N7466_003282 [Penicillium verhagenii]KAJ5936832.1 hypothetical protein N7466_003282 [Penicillium verhagenii]